MALERAIRRVNVRGGVKVAALQAPCVRDRCALRGAKTLDSRLACARLGLIDVSIKRWCVGPVDGSIVRANIGRRRFASDIRAAA
ncbi:MAG: hypothetical protein ACJAYU_004453 [Bradymonadia bacterium]